MATQQQLDTVRKLHELGDRTLEGYDQSIGQYTSDTKDPYEAYHAKIAGGLLTPDIPPVVVTGVTDGTDINFAIDDEITVDSIVEYESTLGTGELTYSSSDEDVALVDNDGLVLAIADGSATITATSVEDGSFTGTTLVTVS